MKIDAASRVLFFAPHPDDESLAAGGLLQRAAARGASVQVVFGTNGDDNPWPLRVVERQWKIDPADRALWGMRRMQEALDALRVLGLPRSSAHFLHLPDQQLTDLLLQGENAVVRQIQELIAAMQPTLLLAPAPFDLHPDHSAFSLLVRLALDSVAFDKVTRLYYAVHTRGYHGNDQVAALELSAQEQAIKRRAILCHRSQMALSRRRFLRHVQPREEFWHAAAASAADRHHPVRGARLESDSLRLKLQRRKRSLSFAGCTLYLAVETVPQNSTRWSVRLPWFSGRAEVRDLSTDEVVGRAQVEIRGSRAIVHLPITRLGPVRQVFVKLKELGLFFDRAGWRELAIATAHDSLGSPATEGRAARRLLAAR